MENLRCDLLDIDETIQRLMQHKDISKSVNAFRSWKYSGSYLLDVDTKNLTDCFQYNPRSCDQSRKGHLTLLELLIDRISASLLAFSLFIEAYQISQPNPKTRACSDRNLLVSTAERFNLVMKQFIGVWGIGTPPRPETTSMHTQTCLQYRAHEPCPYCYMKKNLLKKTIQITSSGLHCDMDDVAQTNSSLKEKLSELSNAQNDAQSLRKKLINKESTLSSSQHNESDELSRSESQLLEKKAEFQKICSHTEDQIRMMDGLAATVEKISCIIGKIDGEISKTYEEVTITDQQTNDLEEALTITQNSRNADELAHVERITNIENKITENELLLSALAQQLSNLQNAYGT